MCSLNCLTLYGVSINAFSRTVTKCDNCNTMATPQYHLTMSDASMRNFCTYQCVMQFQSQFARAPLTLESDSNAASTNVNSSGAATSHTTSTNQKSSSTSGKHSAPFPTGLPKRVKLKGNQQQKGGAHVSTYTLFYFVPTNKCVYTQRMGTITSLSIHLEFWLSLKPPTIAFWPMRHCKVNMDNAPHVAQYSNLSRFSKT